MGKSAAKPATGKPRYTLKVVTMAATAVRAYHNRGKAAARDVGDVDRSVRRARLEMARKRNMFGSIADVRRAIQIADPQKGFRDSDLTALIKLSKQRHSRHILRITSLMRLLLVADRTVRMRLARRMVREDWTQPEVAAVVREHANDPAHGPRRGGGRPPRSPTSPKQIVDEFERLATKWRRFRERLDDEEDDRKKFWAEVDPSLKRKIEAVTVLLESSGLGRGLSIRKEPSPSTTASTADS